MKVLIITNELSIYSGWGRYTLSLVRHLLARGFEVVVLCNKKNNEYQKIKQIEILPNPLSSRKVYWISVFFAYKIYKKIKRENFNMIYCVVEMYSLITFILSKVLNIKYFITLHGTYSVQCFRNKVYGFWQSIAYKNARALVCVSNYTKNRVLRYGNFDNTIVISNGVEDVVVAKRDVQKQDIIVSVGAIKERKGIHVIIKVLAGIKDRIPAIQYYMIGDRRDVAYVNYLKALAKSLGVENNIRYFENLSDSEIAGIYKKAKLFILTPISTEFNFEGFGMVYLEANSHGLPVIGAYGNGGEDAVENNYNGFLVDPSDKNSIESKILSLLEDDNLRESMSVNAMDWAQRHSWGNIINQYIELFTDK